MDMLDHVITWSLKHRPVILALTLLLGFLGLAALRELPFDAFPETTPTQVQVNATAPALSPLEVEQQLCLPLEQELAGLPGLEEVRAVAKFGLAQLTIGFKDGTDIHLARQWVGQRIVTARLPDGVTAELGPLSTGLGEIYHYLVRGEGKTLEELTTLQDWVIAPRLRSLPGVAEVNTWGGHLRQYQVLADLDRLLAHQLSLADLAAALRENNLNVGGGYLNQADEMHLIQGIGLVASEKEIREIVIRAFNGVPVRVGDVATVRIGHALRRGAVTANGKGETVLGLGFLMTGANSHEVAQAIGERLAEIQADLPEGVEIITVYDRAELVDHVLETVRNNLFEGAILVVAILFIFLGNIRAGLIVASAIPCSMLFAFDAMARFGIAGSLMSLGAIDFGLIVDSSVVQVENSMRRLAAQSGLDRLELVRQAAIEVRGPTIFGELIIMAVYLPILALEGVEGKLFRPMALVVIFALIGSMILSVTLIPVLSSLFLPKQVKHQETWLMRGLNALYRPILGWVLKARLLVVTCTLILLGLGVVLASRLGSEFVPRLSEMGIVVNTVRLAGVSLEESIRYGTQLEKLLLKTYPDEIQNVWVRTGMAAVATDPMGIELSDVFISLKPRSSWRKAKSQTELVQLMRAQLEDLPGMRKIFTQPIEMRVNELLAGLRTDVGVKFFGPDLAELASQADKAREILEAIPGSSDVYGEQLTGQPYLEIRVNQEAASFYGVPAAQILHTIEALGGIVEGQIREEQRRFDLVLRLDERYGTSLKDLERIIIPSASGERIPLSRLADLSQTVGPSTLTREWQQRRVLVQCNITGRDLGGFVAEAQQQLREHLALKPGYHFEIGGQYENLIRASQRLRLIIPAALALILVLLYLSTKSMVDTALIFSGAPFAAIGGVLALWLGDMPFTISAGVGFIAVGGVSVFNGLVLVAAIRQNLGRGLSLRDAVYEGASTRLRPVMITALVAAVGFMPMAFNTGIGAEIQKPLAWVVLGGVISDTLLTLLVLPVLMLGAPWRQSQTHSLRG